MNYQTLLSPEETFNILVKEDKCTKQYIDRCTEKFRKDFSYLLTANLVYTTEDWVSLALFIHNNREAQLLASLFAQAYAGATFVKTKPSTMARLAKDTAIERELAKL